MHVKQKPCCARVGARVVMEEASLRRLAAIAAKRQERGLSVVTISERIEVAKASIAQCRQIVIDHDASHAGSPA